MVPSAGRVLRCSARRLFAREVGSVVRRFGGVGLALVLALVCVMAAPSYAAGTGWSREVAFPPASGDEPVGPLYQFLFGSSGCFNAAPSPVIVPQSTWGGTHVAAFGGYAGGCRDTSGGSAVFRLGNWNAPTADFPDGSRWRFTVAFQTNGISKTFTGKLRDASGTVLAGLPNVFTWSGAVSGSVNVLTTDITVSPAARELLMTYQDVWFYALTAQQLGASGGDCVGVAQAGGDAGLVWGSEGIVSHDGLLNGWGHVYDSLYQGCRFRYTARIDYLPPEGVVAGHTMHFGVRLLPAGPGGSNRVSMDWITADGDSLGAIMDYTYKGTVDPGDCGGFIDCEDLGFTAGLNLARLDAPEGAVGIALVFTEGTLLGSLYVADVEGDAVLDPGGTNPSTGGQNTGGDDPWASCAPPADALDVGGWLNYLTCLVLGIPGAFLYMLTNLAYDLFIPHSLGAQWSAFLADVESRVPFGWFSQIVTVISDGLSAGASSLPDWSITFGSSEVDIGTHMDGALAAVAPYRGLLMAGVVLSMTLGCMRWIMAAVGVSPSHDGGDEA